MLPDLGGRVLTPDFFFGPKKDACPQAIRLHQAFHEFNLVDAGSEKEVGESRESLLAQITAPVKIVATGAVTCGKVSFIRIDIARQAARHRPDGAGIERLQQHRMGHQAGNAAIAVNKRMNPHQAMMRRRRAQDRIRLAEAAVNLLEALRESAARRRD